MYLTTAFHAVYLRSLISYENAVLRNTVLGSCDFCLPGMAMDDVSGRSVRACEAVS